VENSILSPGVIVEEQAVVRNSIVMANTIIGRHSVVDRCILDEGVNVGKFSYVGVGAIPIQGGLNITVLGRGASIPFGTALGRNGRVEPGTELLAGVRGCGKGEIPLELLA
jgi:glucose-1-phosphate adenylyltransferase